MGKLIVIEGTDGAGKSTQAPMLASRLREKGYDIREISFPKYESPSGELVKKYLAGEFGGTGVENAYGASAVYAVDRYVSYKTDDWGRFYDEGGIVLATRYTTSNMIYQTAKFERSEWKNYLHWLEDFEYKKIGIPKPDVTVFLDMPLEAAQTLLSKRYEGDNSKKDIHEANMNFLKKTYEAALLASSLLDWKRIKCCDSNGVKSIQAINDELLEQTLRIL